MLQLRLASPEATAALGAAIASVAAGGDVVLLSGDLGAGKTVLTKGLVGGLGGRPESVTSPTFTLCHRYDTEPVVAHADCWRLEDLDEMLDLALEEVLEDGGIAVIEWGERAAPFLLRDALLVRLAVQGVPGEGPGELRSAEVTASGETWGRRLDELAAAARALGLSLTTTAAPQAAEPVAEPR